MEISNSCANCAVSHGQINGRSLGHLETCISDRKVAVLHEKTADEVWEPWRLVFLVLITLF